jgi:hypothetical protein
MEGWAGTDAVYSAVELFGAEQSGRKSRSTGRDCLVVLRFLPCLTKSRQPATLAESRNSGVKRSVPGKARK